jgi:toluene monooxygenase electron transfer component
MQFTVKLNGAGSFLADRGDTLLCAAQRANIGFPYDCSSGGCGNCRFELLSGDVEDLWAEAPGLSERDRARNKLLACQCRIKSDVEIRIRTNDEYLPATLPVKANAKVLNVQNLTHDMREITLQTSMPADFKPGQYALLKTGSVGHPRAYSMSNLPNADGIWQFIIRRVPSGEFTNLLFDTIDKTSTLIIDGPYGLAWLREDAPRDIVCISGGSGFAPMLSIARGATKSVSSRNINFYFGARTPRDVVDISKIESSLGSSSRFNYRIAVSNPEQGWSGSTGFIHELVEQELTGRMDSFEYYVAGPPPMVEAVQEMLFLRHKVPIQQVHQDRFF